MRRYIPLTIAAAVVLLPAAAVAHFRLLTPGSAMIENQLGDPQKMAPCGGVTGNPGVATNVINYVRGGDMLHIAVAETVFHPGHYRIALAVLDRKELPADPMVMTKPGANGPPLSVSADIAQAIASAVAAGWEPLSRGKTIAIDVDAEGG